MCEHLHYEWVYFKELHNDQGYNWPTIYRAEADVVSTTTSSVLNIRLKLPAWAAVDSNIKNLFKICGLILIFLIFQGILS